MTKPAAKKITYVLVMAALAAAALAGCRFNSQAETSASPVSSPAVAVKPSREVSAQAAGAEPPLASPDIAVLKRFVGRWEIKEVYCLPARMPKDYKNSADTWIGGDITIFGNLDFVLDSDCFDCMEINILSRSDIQSRYDLTDGDAALFGDNVIRMYFKSEYDNITLFIKSDDTLIVYIPLSQKFYLLEKMDMSSFEDVTAFTPYIGEWEVSGAYCVPRVGVTSLKGAEESPIMGKRLIISKDLKFNFDGMDFHCCFVYKNKDLNYMMDNFNLGGGDAESFGPNIILGGFENRSLNYLLTIKSDGTLLLFVREYYQTEGFYKLTRVGD